VDVGDHYAGDPSPEQIVVDIDPNSWQPKWRETYGPICAVHNYGCLGVPLKIKELNNGAPVIVDAAAALLTPGAFGRGDIFTVSFNWNKSVSGGSGGAMLTDNEDWAARANGLKRHKGEGAFNFQMPLLCAQEILEQMYGNDDVPNAQERQWHLQRVAGAYNYYLPKYGFKAYPKGQTRWLTGTMFESESERERAQAALTEARFAWRRVWDPLSDERSCPNAWDVYRRGLMLAGGYGILPDDVREVCRVLDNARLS